MVIITPKSSTWRMICYQVPISHVGLFLFNVLHEVNVVGAVEFNDATLAVKSIKLSI